MPGKQNTGMLPQGDHVESLTKLLSGLILVGGRNFSVYTSAKGRVWLTLRSPEENKWGTSVECIVRGDLIDYLTSLTVLLATHISESAREYHFQDKWVSWANVPEEFPRAAQALIDLMAGDQATFTRLFLRTAPQGDSAIQTEEEK